MAFDQFCIDPIHAFALKVQKLPKHHAGSLIGMFGEAEELCKQFPDKEAAILEILTREAPLNKGATAGMIGLRMAQLRANLKAHRVIE